MVTVEVRDTGTGIAAGDLPRIFERFYRGDPARSRGEASGDGRDGAGLGLSIARWIANEHGATIDVTSMAARGTRVQVVYPAAVGSESVDRR